MRASKIERTRAANLSAAVDQLLVEPNAQADWIDPSDAALLDTARQLARLPVLLGAVNSELEQQVVRQVRIESALQQGRMRRFRPAWAAAGIVAILLAVALLTPLGETAVASFMSVFSLGRTEVVITPVDTSVAPLATVVAQSTAISRHLSIEEARAQIPFAIPEPSYLPAGYSFHELVSHTYPDLPAWIPQPFSVDLVYLDSEGNKITLGLYLIMLSDQASISRMNLEATSIKDVQNVEVNGQPAVLLQLGTGKEAVTWQEVVWEHGDLILSLSAADLSQAELLRVAGLVK
jgi:hypothetical protein